MTSLTIGISVLIDECESSFSSISKQVNSIYTFIPSVNVVYCVQSPHSVFSELQSKCHLQIPTINLNHGGLKGVAKSRNILINSCTTDYLWFWDFDCILCKEILDFPLWFQNTTADLFYIKTPNASISNLKSLLRNRFVQSLLKNLYFYPALQFSANAATYNIIIRPSYFCSNQLFFDESLGLGSYFHQSDEVLFLLRYFKNNRGFFSFSRFDTVILHQPLQNLSHIQPRISLSSWNPIKGYVVRALFGSYGLPILPFVAICLPGSTLIAKLKSFFFSVT